MNTIAHDLFRNDVEFVKEISQLARKEFFRRRNTYQAISLFESEDLEQELWLGLFESNKTDREALLQVARNRVRNLSIKGEKRNEIGQEIPVSQLPKDQRKAIKHLIYG